MATTARVFASMPADDELQAILESQRVRRQAARASADLSTAQMAVEIRRKASWIPAATALALAQSGIGPDSPAFEQLSKAAAKRKKKRGFGWHSLGSVVKGAGQAGDFLLGGVDEALTPVAKAGVRGVTLGAQSLYEEAQGAARNVASWDPGGIPVGGAVIGGLTAAALVATAPVSLPALGAGGALVAGGAALGALGGTQVEGKARWELQSSGGVSLERLLHGDKVELGHGFLPNVNAGESTSDPKSTWTIGEEQRRRARQVNINGHAVTPGRLLAVGVTEEGSKPYNLLSGLTDASLALSRFDPASALGRTAGNVNRNRKLFVEAGGLMSARPAIIPEKAAAWWTGATDLKRTLAETQGESAFYDIWQATGGKLGADITHRLATATTDAEIDAIIRPHLGTHNALRGPLDAKFATHRPFENVRLLKTMPGHTIDLRDADQSVQTIERWLQNAKAPREMIAKHTAAMAGANGRVGRFAAYEAAMDATGDVLRDRGWSDAMVSKLTKFQEEADHSTRGFWTNAAAEHVKVPGMWGDEFVEGPKPHAYAEFVNRAQPLPNVRDVRAATSMFAPILQKDAGWIARELTTSTVDFIQGNIWKKSALLRGAYTLRVVGEEQMRMAASGLDSLVHHPLSLIGMRLSEDSVLGRAAAKVGVKVDKARGGMLGENFLYRDADEFVDGLDEYNAALNRSWAGWADDRRKLPVWAKYSPGQDGFHNVWAGELSKLHSDPVGREVARRLTRGDSVDDLYDEFFDGGLSGYRKSMAEEATGLNQRAVSDAYVDSMVERIQYTTGGDADLVDMVATGRIHGGSYRDGVKPSKELRDHLAVSVDAAPANLYGQATILERGVGQYYDQATRWLFSNLMSERTNNLSRSPTFRQLYWQRAEELVPFMDEPAKTAMIAEARANKLDDVVERVSGVEARGDLGLEHADTIAKGFALDGTRDLLYDMVEKGQFFDAHRMIFPFGEAWKEMITRWGRIGVERPQALRRGQQFITGARNAGFFYENANGEEVFAYPGSEIVSDKLFGVPVPLTGRVAGLSLMTEVLPGVGPVAQIAAGGLLPDKPEWDWAQSLLFPFGEPDVKHGTLEAFLPAWAQKFRQAGVTPLGQDEGQWNSTVMDVARWLASTGKYDTSTPEGVSEMLDAARSKAKAVYVLRGAAQFFAPTAPTPEWVVADKHGDAQVAQVLVKEYQDLLEDDYQSATDKMLDKYGDGLWLLLQGKTAEVTPAAPVTAEGAKWERSNGALVKRFANTYGFFAPQGGDLDLTVYGRQLESGARQRLTPEQAVRLANDRVANAVFQKAKSELGPRVSKGQQAALRNLRGVLKGEYPGYGDRSGIPERVSTDTLIDELTDAAGDERLADNPVTSPLRQYLEARELAADAAESRGLSRLGFRSAKQMAGMRTALRALGAALVSETPAFGEMFDRVFDRELVDDEETTDGES